MGDIKLESVVRRRDFGTDGPWIKERLWLT